MADEGRQQGVCLKKIDGQKHFLMKLLADIQNEDGRVRNRLFFAEGREMALRAFNFGAEFHALLLAREFAGDPDASRVLKEAGDNGVDVYCAGSGLIGKVLKSKPVPRCIAILKRKVCRLSDVFSNGSSLVVGVEHGENADNLGMLLRSAEAANVDAVVLAADTVDPFNRRTVRGSRGAVFSLRICVKKSMSEVLERAKTAGFTVTAASAHADTVYSETDMTRPAFLIVGNEHHGLTKETMAAADSIARIPMMGGIGSLNIAVAASLLMYEARRQRGFRKD